jgi:hypothetical protein
MKVPPTSPACKYIAFKAQNYTRNRTPFLYIKKQNDKKIYKIRLDAKSFGQSIALFAATHT